MSVITLARSNSTYALPLKPRLKFTSLDATDEYFTFSPLESITDVNVIYVDCERASFETGSFNIVVEDSNNVIAKDHLRNARVTIELGKTLATIKPFMVGYADIFTDRRPRNFYQDYLLTGPSSKIRAAELMLLIRKAADNPNNPNYGIANLVIDSIKKRKWRPLNREDIESITGWNAALREDGGGISGQLNKIKYTVINEVFTTLWDWLERMSAITGAPWDIDYDSSFNETLTMGYPSTRGTGIVIKSSDLASTADIPEKTSYLYDNFSIEDNSSSDAGVATRLYTTTIIDRQVISSQMTNRGSSNLVSKALVQQVIIENDQRRITDLSFILSKVGDPQSSKDRINGDIVMDLGDNTPRGQTLATFKIPLSDIKTTPDTIFVNDVDVKIRFLQGENKIWIRLFQRSGIKGNPNTDSANTIFWHHNGVLNTPQTLYSGVSTGTGAGDYSLKNTLTWSAQNNGPIYCYEVFSNIRRLQARSNPSQAKVIRIKEGFIDTSFLNQVDENNLYLSRQLANRSKARRSIQNIPVTVPNNFLFKPYQNVAFGDSLSNEFQELTVQRARYIISAQSAGDYPLGALYAEVSLGGSFNSLLGNCSCL